MWPGLRSTDSPPSGFCLDILHLCNIRIIHYFGLLSVVSRIPSKNKDSSTHALESHGSLLGHGFLSPPLRYLVQKIWGRVWKSESSNKFPGNAGRPGTTLWHSLCTQSLTASALEHRGKPFTWEVQLDRSLNTKPHYLKQPLRCPFHSHWPWTWTLATMEYFLDCV